MKAIKPTVHVEVLDSFWMSEWDEEKYSKGFDVSIPTIVNVVNNGKMITLKLTLSG